MARLRTFIALDVGRSVRDHAVLLQRQLTKIHPDVNWVAPDNLHITLLFLGELSDTEIHTVCRSTARASKKRAPFPISIAEVGAFPNLRRPKILWVGVQEGAERVRELFTDIETLLFEQGLYRKEERQYHPHMTLGRIRHEQAGQALAPELQKLGDWKAGDSEITRVTIYASELRREGPEYSVIGHADLGG